MTSPYGPSGGNDPQQPQWGQQPPTGGGYSGTPSGGFPAQNPYGPPDPNQQNQQPQWGQLPPHEQATQKYQQGGYDPNAPQQQNPYAAPQQPQGGYDPTQQVQQPQQPQGGYDPTQQVQSNPYGMPQQGGQFGQQQPQNPYGAPQQGQQYGQQQNPYGQPNPYGQQQNPYGQTDPYGQQQPKKSGAVLWVVVALVVLVAAAVGITGFVAPGFFVSKVFDNAEVQKGVVSILKDEYKIPDVESATCPGEHKVKVGATFECTAQVGGNEKKVKVTVKTADGEYEVGQPTG